MSAFRSKYSTEIRTIHISTELSFSRKLLQLSCSSSRIRKDIRHGHAIVLNAGRSPPWPSCGGGGCSASSMQRSAASASRRQRSNPLNLLVGRRHVRHTCGRHRRQRDCVAVHTSLGCVPRCDPSATTRRTRGPVVLCPQRRRCMKRAAATDGGGGARAAPRPALDPAGPSAGGGGAVRVVGTVQALFSFG